MMKNTSHFICLLGLGFIFPAYAFKMITIDGKPTRWRERVVPFVLDSKNSDNFNGSCDKAGPCIGEKEAVRRAFRAWQNVKGSSITFSEPSEKNIKSTGYDNENSIVWIESGWKKQSFTPPSGALAVTISTYNTSDGRMRDSDIHFNGEDFQWANIDTEEEKNGVLVDVQNIATHEIGHFFGLDHSSEDIYETKTDLYMATMFFASGPGELFRRDLKADDMAALRYLYPAESAEYPIIDGATPNAWDARNDPIVVMEIEGANFGETTNAILTSGNNGSDIHGKIVSNTGKKLSVAFDVYQVASSKYNLVISNSADTPERLDNAIEIRSYGEPSNAGNGEAVTQSARAADGGCATSTGNSNSERLILLIFIPLALLSLRNRELA